MKRAIVIAVLAVACKDSNPHPNVTDAPPKIDAAVDAPIDAPLSCVDPVSGCFDTTKCDPVNLDDFLNACTTVACQQFDNVARLPLYNNGNLPALP